MAKTKTYDLSHEQELAKLGKALSSPDRIKIIDLLSEHNMIISDIARVLELSQSSVAFHLKILEEAGIVRMEEQPGKHGVSKLCSPKLDYVNIDFMGGHNFAGKLHTVEMPVGSFTECEVFPTCGLCTKDSVIGMEDQEYSFYLPERRNAELLWTSRGYVTYRFANMPSQSPAAKDLSFTLEICSEAPGYKEDWKSDITFWINQIECATWTCPGDFGSIRGRLNPSFWEFGQTQYGKLVTLRITERGCYFNQKLVSDISLSDLNLKNQPYIELKIGNKEDAYYIGGFNIFGKNFGNYEQAIVMTLAC